MDEKLAKGYANQLISWFEDDLSNAARLQGESALRSNKIFSSPKSFVKFAIRNREIYKNFCLSYLIGNSAKKPYFAFVAFSPSQEKYKDWKEKNIVATIGYLQYAGDEGMEIERGLFIIGEHALARTFQRSNLINATNANNPYAILSEFKYIPLWVSFWEFFKIYLNKNFLEFSPIIPSNNGIFLCEYEMLGEKASFVHLRTYVGKSDLSEEQENLRMLMINASKNLESSTFTFFPFKVGNYKYQDMLDFYLICNRVKSFIPQLSKEIFKNKDEVEISIFARNALETIKKMVTPNIDSLDLKLNALGYQDFIIYLEREFKNTVKENAFRV